MLSIQAIRDRADDVRASMRARGEAIDVDAILRLDEEHRSTITDMERMRAERNQAGKSIGAAKDNAERQRLIEEQRAVAGHLDGLEERGRALSERLEAMLLEIPNLLHEDVPAGGEADAVVILEGVGAGEPDRIDPPRRAADDPPPEDEDGAPPPHWETGEELHLIDFERGAKISGSRFYVLREAGARLQRALITWMLDLHREAGFRELYVPFVVRGEMLVGTGQLPKFAETMYHDAEDDLWLVPTAEVPVTNLYRDEILEVTDLPLHHVAYTPCFRRERMSAGRDVRGIKRGHQFDKVELVKLVEPVTSSDELDSLLERALAVVRALGFRYRVVRLASEDVSFASSMTFDVEVWAPGSREWLEVSSVSNYLDFQARRANLRYRDAEGKVQHLHTLNGSGLALPRTLAVLLEQYWQPDGSIEVPVVLRPYLGGMERIEVQGGP